MKLCIDPGHGYANRRAGVYDPGAVFGGISEADVCLQWALTLKWVLGREGIDCWLTRDDDTDPSPVGSRDDRSEQAGCTHFLSLHCNAADRHASGTETFYRDEADKRWAAMVQGNALAATGGKNRGLKSESESQHNRLAVFDFDGPCALLEIEFIDGTNRAVLTSRDARVQFAEGMAATIKGIVSK